MDTMNNQKFYVRQTTTPGTVKIETHYKGEEERRRPLTDVADLIQGILSTFIPQINWLFTNLPQTDSHWFTNFLL